MLVLTRSIRKGENAMRAQPVKSDEDEPPLLKRGWYK
jgi:hypothetical protein